jgi:hypothetical protein
LTTLRSLAAVLCALALMSTVATSANAAGVSLRPLPAPTIATSISRASIDYPAIGAIRDSSGIAVVGDLPIQVSALTEKEAMAFDAALDLALKNRDDFGYPWIRPDTRRLELAAADADGTGLAETARSSAKIRDVATTITTAPASIGELDAIAEAVTQLNAEGFPDADLIYMTEPDQRDNLIVITVSEASPRLTSALAERFGTSLIAVRVRPIDAEAGSLSRASDNPAFWGGAKINVPAGTCTTGFAWGTSATMLMAAHCAPSGGNVGYTNYPNAGSVRSGSEENWSTSTGTQYYTNQITYRGDVALVRYNSPLTSAGRIYSGSQTSSSSKAVAGMATRRAQFSDPICNNGFITGPWCGAVLAMGSNILYAADGPNVWARNVVEGYAGGNTCPTHGDSGSPVYQNRSDGKVTAYGILSGSLPLVISCHMFFTDIRDAFDGLPGGIKTG